ncbi:uncharacterized protein K460DRAFT_416279 [Cucurbitaria berberidis CBS 394.84]|uniref:Uncharacterized protein n=1 Tax=Cucurbitaria berberidis CBS 394.84 TaxID=1168544 RepID=A0A9P4L7G3_9PLEO|nr:uncharacterized protein K460DRAFT_416279 [Cucurbitaria berberidis CBS 394.84]KAF1844925.1 hypothetical protein K460DRAFT_416279 [Cucurbitaria berberidis CBS 394.84]
MARDQNSGQRAVTRDMSTETQASVTPINPSLSLMHREDTTTPVAVSTAASTAASTAVSTSDLNTLPPDVAEARRTRINHELVTIFKRPCPPNSTPTAKGIGLYTHVAGPVKIPIFPHERYMENDPEYLPVGGPREVGNKTGLEGQTAEEVKKVWHEVMDAMQEERKVLGPRKRSARELKERYAALDVPGARAPPRLEALVVPQVAGREDIVAPEHSTTPQSAGLRLTGRRPSGVSGLAHETGATGDVTMGGTEIERRGSGSALKSGNQYYPSRDPRIQGRK